jgi:hypothetical protein
MSGRGIPKKRKKRYKGGKTDRYPREGTEIIDMEQQVYMKRVVMELTLVHGDGEHYRKGGLYEGELDQEREVEEGELDWERVVHEKTGLHEMGFHGFEGVQDSEGDLNGNLKRDLLHGRR